MKHIIENLYNLMPNSSTSISRMFNHKEWDLYNKICNQLFGDLLSAFMEYTQLRSQREAKEKKSSYIEGFKTAVNLILESTKSQ